jgi:S1-C subfamily serine protease
LDVTFVRSHGPVERAGINEVDIVVGLQGSPMTSLQELDLAIQDAVLQIGSKGTDSLQFDVLRNGKIVRVDVPFPLGELDL